MPGPDSQSKNDLTSVKWRERERGGNAAAVCMGARCRTVDGRPFYIHIHHNIMKKKRANRIAEPVAVGCSPTGALLRSAVDL